MFNLRPFALWATVLLTAGPTFAQAPSGERKETVDMPCQLPGLVWDDVVDVASAPWRSAPGDWTPFFLGAAAVAGTALLLDHPIQKAVQRNVTPSLTRWSNNLEPLGNTYSIGVAGGLYVVGLLAKDAQARATGADSLSALAISTLVLVPLKSAVGRARPEDNLGDHSFKPFSPRDSFPSAHTTFAFAAASVITEHYDTPWVQATAYGLATLAGLARLEQNAHWASDVLTGALLGTGIGKAVVHLNQKRRFGKRGQVRFAVEPQLGLGYQGIKLGMIF